MTLRIASVAWLLLCSMPSSAEGLSSTEISGEKRMIQFAWACGRMEQSDLTADALKIERIQSDLRQKCDSLKDAIAGKE